MPSAADKGEDCHCFFVMILSHMTDRQKASDLKRPMLCVHMPEAKRSQIRARHDRPRWPARGGISRSAFSTDLRRALDSLTLREETN